ncbi:flagellar motor protein MotB [Maritimibacter sp. UBA3975]|uniref:flagellar motor protein MotB n=1 Tax=Maritimibacter sp. UBA3975 TaxID=1946833 RepID=UPI000C0B95CB|nr:flagellar motor protein MotB [Maritimibacter sp. UBA3975]MAM61870.1 chemotaxis protein MotB [Maritimibacter sp.]|tara:strand:+ start:12265 stop:13110 length:846 start_codon:yes stop_codon:yes gene_type:complete
MSAQANAPIIIKKVKKSGGEGHHGGAWKVAYADFVTAMMAFFMLMWLLNATTEKQRKGIADYFSPTIPVNRVSGGGQDAFGGDSVFTEESLAQTGQGGLPSPAQDANSEAPDGGAGDGNEIDEAAEARALEEIEEVLTGRSGESMASDLLQRHIVTELTDEGLVIELFDIDGEPLFDAGTAQPTAVMVELVGVMAKVFDLVTNGVAIEGHTRAEPIVLAQNTVWEMSNARADRIRQLLGDEGLSPRRVQRVTGHADRQPAARNPMALRNNRIELILLRTKR